MSDQNRPREWQCRLCGKRCPLSRTKCPECGANLSLYGDIVFVEEGSVRRVDPTNIFSWLIGSDPAKRNQRLGLLLLALLLLLLSLGGGILAKKAGLFSPKPTLPPAVAFTTTATTQPTTAPTTVPKTQPTTAPTTQPTTQPTTAPTTAPTTQPTTAPTTAPTTQPTTAPTTAPTTQPTTAPTTLPTTQPTQPPKKDDRFPYLGGMYEGPVISPKVPHGTGKLVWDGGYFEGNFDNGYPKGDGTFIFDNGVGISGNDWSYGSMEFRYPAGMLKGEKGGTYTGLILNSQAVGYGELEFEYAGTYSGCFRSNEPSGTGVFVFADGTKATGTWSWISGRTMQLYSGKMGSEMVYTGMANGSSATGFGMLEFEKCGTFYGEFQNEEPNGKGAYAYLEPRPSSQPVMQGDDWFIVRGEYAMEHTYTGLKQGKSWQGYGIGIKSSGYYYCGEVRDMCRSGYGRVFSSSNKLDHHGIHVDGVISVRYPK